MVRRRVEEEVDGDFDAFDGRDKSAFGAAAAVDLFAAPRGATRTSPVQPDAGLYRRRPCRMSIWLRSAGFY